MNFANTSPDGTLNRLELVLRRQSRLLWSVLGTSVLVAGVFSLQACGSSDDSPMLCGPGGECPQGQVCRPSDNLCRASGVADFITSIREIEGTATLAQQSGDLPAAGGGPTVTVTSPETAINGGTVHVTLDGSASFDRIIVAVEGVPGYYLVTLPAAVATADLLITLSQNIARSGFNFRYAVGSSTGIGAYEDVAATLVSVGTGDVQVSVSWDVESDVDLHVVDPSGNEVFYGQPTAPSGGMLDLDSNPGCSIDHVKNENITWATATSGAYTVRLDYFQSCGVAVTNYVVTVQVKGQAAQTFPGMFTGSGDTGFVGAGIDITTFTVP